MNYGGDAADQIVRYSLDGVDHGLRLSGTLAKHLAVFVAAVLKDQKKTRGRTRMVRMLKENKPLKFFTVPSDRLREFCSEGRKRGLLYVIIRDKKNPERGKRICPALPCTAEIFLPGRKKGLMEGRGNRSVPVSAGSWRTLNGRKQRNPRRGAGKRTVDQRKRRRKREINER